MPVHSTAVSGVRLTPRMLLAAYSSGAFPMTDADGVTRWYTADPRGVLPLDRFHVPKTLAALVRQDRFTVRVDHDFTAVMRACRDVPRQDHGDGGGGWIGEDLIRAYSELAALGFAHSVEAWQDGRLVGGLYGVALGGAFFGESMFHHVPNASKVALVHLVRRLGDRGYALLDTQMVTGHMKQFGCVYVPAAQYQRDLAVALRKTCTFV